MIYFLPKETCCRCGCGFDLNDDFKVKVNAFREAMGFAMTLTSAARCPSHNIAVGGAKSSKHMSGCAVDIKWDHLDAATKSKMLGYAMDQFGGIGLHKVFLHIDSRVETVVWFY